MRQVARRFLSVLLATTLVFGPAQFAFAQDADPDAEYKALTNQAQEKFKAKDYDAAAKLFIEAYELKPVSNILYNIARIYEQAGNLESALEYYQKFVKSPNVMKENRDDALDRIKSLKEVLALEEEDTKEEDTEVAEPVKPAEPEYDYTLAYIFWGTGAATLAGSLVFGILASDQHSKFEDATTIEERRDAASSGETLSIVSDSLLITGAVLGVLGTVFFFTASPVESNDGVAITPIIGTDRVGMGLSFGF